MTQRTKQAGGRRAGERTYRALGYPFTVRWTWPAAGRYIEHVLADLADEHDPIDGLHPQVPAWPPTYTLEDAGPGDPLRYRLLLDGALLRNCSEPENVVHHLLWHVNGECFRRTGSYLVVHAGSVSSPQGLGVVMPAISGSGKTTLTAALVRAGFGYLSDEAAAIDPVSGVVHPYPRALHLKEGSASLLVSTNGHRYPGLRMHSTFVRADDLRPGSVAGPAETALIVLPLYRPGHRLAVEEVGRAEALTVMGRNLLNLGQYRSRALPLLARVAAGARAVRMTYSSLDDAVNAVADQASWR